MIIWIWLATVIFAVVLYFRHIYTRFSRHDVKGFTPVPVLGTMWPVLLKINHMSEDIEYMYKAFPDERFVGKFDFMSPAVLIRDLELVKKITIKDFENFLDHQTLADPVTDPLFGRSLFALKGEEWKDMRSTLSPAFTSSKIRHMLPFMMEVGDQMIQSLKEQFEDSKVNHIDIDTKELMSRYANDVIYSCAFGLKVDSHTNKDNQFYEMGKITTNISVAKFLALFAFASFPNLIRILNISIMTESTKRFFKNLVFSTMREREEQNIMRPDMIHLLMEAKKGKLSYDEKLSQDADAGFATVQESAVGRKKINRVWADTDLVAQATVFFFAGFEAISSIMTFMLYELAVHPNAQEKLYQEIKEHDGKNGGKFDYTSIQQMKYLDMVISEVLRLWSNPMTDRVCIKDYNIGRPNAEATEDYIVRKGESVQIPVWAIHRDPAYFPNPNQFDPERFSEENKHQIKPFTYMPFGVGPRNCIGSRFALCELKVMACQLLRVVEVSPCEKTPIPAQLDKNSASLRMKGGHMLRYTVRATK